MANQVFLLDARINIILYSVYLYEKIDLPEFLVAALSSVSSSFALRFRPFLYSRHVKKKPPCYL